MKMQLLDIVRHLENEHAEVMARELSSEEDGAAELRGDVSLIRTRLAAYRADLLLLLLGVEQAKPFQNNPPPSDKYAARETEGGIEIVRPRK